MIAFLGDFSLEHSPARTTHLTLIEISAFFEPLSQLLHLVALSIRCTRATTGIRTTHAWTTVISLCYERSLPKVSNIAQTCSFSTSDDEQKVMVNAVDLGNETDPKCRVCRFGSCHHFEIDVHLRDCLEG